MRRLLVLALLLAAVGLTAAQPPYTIPNDACKQIVEAFAQRDFALLMPVLFNLDDDAAFDSLFRASKSVDETAITEYSVSRSDLAEDYERNLMSLQRQFNAALVHADSLGLDLANSQYDGFIVHGKDMWMGYNIFFDFEIGVTCEGQIYWLNPGILRETPHGWKLAAGQGCRFCWR